MEPLIQISAIGAPLRLANVNTDQLFPARFIKKPRAVGYAQYLFHDIRRTDAGDINPNFSLNHPKFETAKILFAGANFGSGSSREGAVYALYDSGFRAVFAPSFGEIFAANCLKNGVLTARLDQETIQSIQEALGPRPRAEGLGPHRSGMHNTPGRSGCHIQPRAIPKALPHEWPK